MNRRFCLAAAGALLAFVALPMRANACSMCQCGDPTYRLMGDDFFSAHSFRASLNADRHSKDQVSEDDPTGREKETENRLALSASWQPVPRLRLVGRVPYVQRTIEVGGGESKLSGLGDPDLFAHVNLLESGNVASGWWLAAMAGVKAPWGQSDMKLDGVRAEEHLQPGSGATAEFAGLAFAHGIGGGAHLYTSAMGRWNGTNSHEYRYGDALLANLALQRAFASSVSGSLELNYRASKHDLAAGERDPNTGGAVLYVSPKVQFSLGSPVGLQLGVQIPVAKNLNGDQREFANFESGVVFAF